MNKKDITYLVLSRKIGESFVIGDDIEVKLVEKKGTMYRIKISAPRDVAIYRKELLEQKEKNDNNGD